MFRHDDLETFFEKEKGREVERNGVQSEGRSVSTWRQELRNKKINYRLGE